MSKLTIVFGGQFGSEGKGQVVGWLHQRTPFDYGVRVGGPNAGHTFLLPNGKRMVARTVPIPAFMGAVGVIGPGGIISPEVMAAELHQACQYLGRPTKLIIDRNATLISAEHTNREKRLRGEIGSTGEGVGAALSDKIMRRPDVVVGRNDLVKEMKEALEHGDDPCDSSCLEGVELTEDTAYTMNKILIGGGHLVVEGTQGFALSLHTGGYYPFCTSRECTPQGILAETGINQDNAGRFESLMVIRTFPIRVGGNSGELPGEISWKDLEHMTHGYVREPEMTTVTRKQRRIALLDWDLLKRAVAICHPTGLVITFLDYKFPGVVGIKDSSGLEKDHWAYIGEFEKRLGIPVKMVSTGPGMIVPLRVTI